MINQIKIIILALLLLVLSAFAFSFEVTKVYKERFPELRFIGKSYADGSDFGNKFGEWFQNNWFIELEKLGTSELTGNSEIALAAFNANDDSVIAAWIGLFFPADTEVPEGFEYLDLPESDVGFVWIHGNEPSGELYSAGAYAATYQKLVEEGLGKLNENAGGTGISVVFQLYNHERFIHDEEKNATLDYGRYIIVD